MNIRKITIAALAAYVGGLGALAGASYERVTEQPVKSRMIQRLTRFTGDPYIAEVLAKTEYPFELAAIAKIESGFRPLVKGDSGASFGLYQIQEKHWGMVPRTVEGQTRKAEKIFHNQVIRYGRIQAIAKWNGTGERAEKYRSKVLLAMKEI